MRSTSICYNFYTCYISYCATALSRMSFAQNFALIYLKPNAKAKITYNIICFETHRYSCDILRNYDNAKSS